MAEENGTAAKRVVEIRKVEMSDGRVVAFAGKRNMNKDFEITDTAIKWTFDFSTGDTLKFEIAKDDPMIFQLAGHGGLQKAGDEAAGVKDDNGQPDVSSMALAVEAVALRLVDTTKSLEDRWYTERAAGDGFSGAAVVVKAIMEATKGSKKYPEGMSLAEVKGFLNEKLEAGKGEGLTRQKLYQSFRKPGTKTAGIIARLEQEKLAAAAGGVDADAELEAATS